MSNFLVDIVKETIGGYQALNTFGPYVQPVMKLITGCVVADLAVKFFVSGSKKVATSEMANDLGKLKGKDGFILGKNNLGKKYQLSYKYTREGIVCVAPTGEGKTTSIVITQLLSNHLPKCSIVIHDTKGEIYEFTSEYQKSIGRLPVLFEPLGNGGIRINPLDFCENETEVKQLAQTILINGSLGVRLLSGSGSMSGSDATWINMSLPLFVASLIYHKHLGRPYDNIPTAVRFLINNKPNVIENTFINCGIDAVGESYNTFAMAVGNQEDGGGSGPLTSILTTLATNLTLFLDNNLARNICESDFTPHMLREKQIALYVKYDPLKANYISPFVAIFYSQLLEKLMDYHTVETHPVFMILDEYQNLGKINNMVQVATLCRYRDIPLIVFVQSLSRLYQIYGKNETDSILNNLKTKLILPSLSEVDTMKYVSELCGFTEIEKIENNRKITIKKKLFEPDEVRRIEDEKCVVVAHNLMPLKCRQLRYYDDDEMLLNRYMGGL